MKIETNCCAICHEPICDLYYLQVGACSVHLNCLKCEVCLKKLEMHGKCYLSRNGKFYCREHTGDECKRCKRPIGPNDYVIKVTESRCVYHLNCFKCTQCDRLIQTGSKYGVLNDESIYCSEHYLQALNKHDFNRSSIKPTLDNSNPTNHYIHHLLNSNTTQNPTSDCSSTKSSSSSSSSSSSTSSSFTNRKKKRVRTSFKHQQLRIMKAHFQINQNPDSKDLKELSERTGLQKRVLQVWFQNSRAKQRKYSSNQYSLKIGNLSSGTGAAPAYQPMQQLNGRDSRPSSVCEDYSPDYAELDTAETTTTTEMTDDEDAEFDNDDEEYESESDDGPQSNDRENPPNPTSSHQTSLQQQQQPEFYRFY